MVFFFLYLFLARCLLPRCVRIFINHTLDRLIIYRVYAQESRSNGTEELSVFELFISIPKIFYHMNIWNMIRKWWSNFVSNSMNKCALYIRRILSIVPDDKHTRLSNSLDNNKRWCVFIGSVWFVELHCEWKHWRSRAHRNTITQYATLWIHTHTHTHSRIEEFYPKNIFSIDFVPVRHSIMH